MSHPVICSICGKRFDRDLIQAVHTGARRYAHAKCDPNNKDFVPLVEKPEQDPDMAQLKDYITNKYGDKARWPLINKQIRDFVKKGYTISGIFKSLVWFYDVKGNKIEGSNGGIGIVDYCYQDAYNYYYNLFVIQSRNQNKDIPTIVSKEREIIIKPPKRPIKKRFFKFLDNDNDDEEVDNE